jgi:hypothetical protein
MKRPPTRTQRTHERRQPSPWSPLGWMALGGIVAIGAIGFFIFFLAALGIAVSL